MKIGLVLEGGGMRGLYTIGVLDGLMSCGFNADYVIGVSAGACNGASYVSGQKGRNLRVEQTYLKDPRYVGLGSLAKTGSMFGMDFIFDEIPNRLDPFDYDAFYRNPAQYVVGVTDVHTGKPVYFNKDAVEEKNTLLRASSSIPCFSPIVQFNGGEFLDGGTSDPIPVEKALEDGCDRVVVVLTRDRSYQKKPEALGACYRFFYRKYPGLIETMDNRHHIYNRQLARLRVLEREGVATVIAPREPVKVGRFERDMAKLTPLYKSGKLDAVRAYPALAKLRRQAAAEELAAGREDREQAQ